MRLYLLLTLYMAEAYNYEWVPVCETESGDGGFVRGDIVTRFHDDKGISTVVMDNLEQAVEAKCSDHRGKPRIHQGEEDITPEFPPYESNGDHMPPNTSRPNVKVELWQRNFTTFWKSEKLIKCRSGDRNKSATVCSMKVIEVKDGSRVKGNCTTVVGSDDLGQQMLVCDVRDWIQNAMSSRNSQCMKNYDLLPGSYEYSFRDQNSNSWTKCLEFNEDSPEQIDEKVFFLKCNITSRKDQQFLVRMHKKHKSKLSAGLSYLASSAPCDESSYFWVQRGGGITDDHVKIPVTVFGIVVSLVVILVLLAGGLCIRKEIYKRKFITMRSLTEDTEQGAPLSEYERSNSAFQGNYSELEKPLTPVQADFDENDKSDQINPALPMTDMMHLLDLDPRLEIPRQQVKLGYYLGQGQFGTVYEGSVTGLLGEQPGKIVKVAVKEIKDTQAEGWCDELKILSNLEMHVNLVNLLGACTMPSDLPTYILLEYCSFGDMKKFLCKHKDEFESRIKGVPGNYESPYTAKLLLKWSYSIAQGMAYLARMKIMHGDLAARNIMVGENYVAKISDFGLSKVIPYYNEDYKKTQRKLIPWAWMATEYLKTGDFNIKSDVWSFGVVLWEIFTVGNRPYGINPDYECEKMKILGGERLPLPDLADLIPCGREVYEEVMLACWMEEARQRPDFAAIVTQLGEFLGEEEVAQYDVQRRGYEEKQQRRSRAPNPPVRMDSLGDQCAPPPNGYIAMEDVTSPTSSTGSGYSMAVSGSGGYIGLQQVIQT